MDSEDVIPANSDVQGKRHAPLAPEEQEVTASLAAARKLGWMPQWQQFYQNK